MPKLPIHTARMFEVIEYLVESGQIENQKEFCNVVGMADSSLSHIKQGRRDFTVDQMMATCKRWKVNMNWVFGFENNMMREKAKSSLAKLKEAVREIEIEMKK